MTELVLLLILGITLLLVFLDALLRSSREEAEVPDMAKLTQIVPLPGIAFKNPDLLLSDGDYKWLRGNPSLERVARQHWHDRRKMVLIWLRLLQSDLLSLWRLRRWLAGYGVATNAREELRIFGRAVLALTFIVILRFLVWLSGPFIMVRFLRSSRTQADAISQSSARLLARIPPSQWPEVQQACALRFRSEPTL